MRINALIQFELLFKTIFPSSSATFTRWFHKKCETLITVQFFFVVAVTKEKKKLLWH